MTYIFSYVGRPCLYLGVNPFEEFSLHTSLYPVAGRGKPSVMRIPNIVLFWIRNKTSYLQSDYVCHFIIPTLLLLLHTNKL